MAYTYEVLREIIKKLNLPSGQIHYLTDGIYGEVIHENIRYSIELRPIGTTFNDNLNPNDIIQQDRYKRD